jgi:transcriptional regulator with XRE-family HTH domain
MQRYNRIEEFLDARGTKKKWLAEQLDVTPSTVSKWCANTMQPRIEMLYRIAEVLDVEVRELLVPSKG